MTFFMMRPKPRISIEASGIATPTSTALRFQRIHFLNWEVAPDTEVHSGGLSKADKMADLSDNPPGW